MNQKEKESHRFKTDSLLLFSEDLKIKCLSFLLFCTFKLRKRKGKIIDAAHFVDAGGDEKPVFNLERPNNNFFTTFFIFTFKIGQESFLIEFYRILQTMSKQNVIRIKYSLFPPLLSVNNIQGLSIPCSQTNSASVSTN